MLVLQFLQSQAIDARERALILVSARRLSTPYTAIHLNCHSVCQEPGAGWFDGSWDGPRAVTMVLLAAVGRSIAHHADKDQTRPLRKFE